MIPRSLLHGRKSETLPQGLSTSTTPRRGSRSMSILRSMSAGRVKRRARHDRPGFSPPSTPRPNPNPNPNFNYNFNTYKGNVEQLAKKGKGKGDNKGSEKRKAPSGPCTVAGEKYKSKDAVMIKASEIAKKNPDSELEVLEFHPKALPSQLSCCSTH
jgi:hypothetical protein